MARSHRTLKPSLQADRRIARDGDGAPLLPRIIARKPRRGDVHALSPEMVRTILGRVPVEQLFGLRRIELRARTDRFGDPFAHYLRDERTIRLYSVPDGEWPLSLHAVESLRLGQYRARVRRHAGGVTVAWSPPDRVVWRALWFWIEVLAHELGHHVRNQYRARHPRVARTRDEESVADLYSRRSWAALLRAAAVDPVS
jgi:hypothetical protein